MSLRARLVLVVAAAVAAAVVLASLLIYFLVRNELYAGVDRSLQHQLLQVYTQPLEFANAIGPKTYVIHVRQAPFSNPWQLVDARGATYRPGFGFEQRTAPLLPGLKKAQEVASGDRGDFYFESHYDGEHVRLLVSRHPPYAVEVVASLRDVDRELGKIKLWLFLVALGGVGVASIAGFLVARAALAPVRELSDTAERVRSTRDLTQRIRVEGSDELSRLAATFNAMLESLDEAARLQRRLVQDASHELRTPLTSLRTNIEVLARADALPAAERETLLADVVEQLTEMSTLVSELVQLARGDEPAGEPEIVRLDELVAESVERARRNSPRVTFATELYESTVEAVPAALERAVGNLLDNAAKWSPPGGTVEVAVVDHEVAVRDHGPGIDESDLPFVFDRFYRAPSARGMPGSGLGLAIVHQVAKTHGGDVIVERPRDGGTLMRLRLPVGPAA
jgi:two-component system, OmpR family, sensor histidine kinase MprB